MKGGSMTESNVKEKLCLLLDGEMGPEESLRMLDRIEGDSELKEQWRRYCLITETMRSGRVLMPDANFVDRVSAALADEPTVLAPTHGKRRIPEKVVTAALAASLVLVAVVVGRSLSAYSPVRGADLFASADLTTHPARSPVDPEVRDYLVTHYETAYLAGAQGMLPSVRLVSSDSIR
jgi:sigma-E factor negative regulatory protein RseA